MKNKKMKFCNNLKASLVLVFIINIPVLANITLMGKITPPPPQKKKKKKTHKSQKLTKFTLN